MRATGSRRTVDFGELLTEQGGQLVKVTIEALRQLKFGVEDVDEDLTPGTAKVEDLRLIRSEHDPAWTNITEVRGYTGGAKLKRPAANWPIRRTLSAADW